MVFFPICQQIMYIEGLGDYLFWHLSFTNKNVCETLFARPQNKEDPNHPRERVKTKIKWTEGHVENISTWLSFHVSSRGIFPYASVKKPNSFGSGSKRLYIHEWLLHFTALNRYPQLLKNFWNPAQQFQKYQTTQTQQPTTNTSTSCC